MLDGLATTIIVVALVVAGFSVVTALLNRPPSFIHLIGLSILEIALVVQAVVAFGKLFTGDRPAGMATFVGYLLTVILLPPLAALMGWAERSRWGSGIVAAAGAVVAVMVLRLQQVWHA
jgi:hypothetical protein